LLVISSALPALAQYEPVIVIPGKPGVPVILNGVDASWAVVEGDWGLARPHPAPSAIYGSLLLPLQPPRDTYFPSTGRSPGYGRYEVDPGANRPPQPAQSYHRNWSSASDPGPVTEYAPFDVPPVIVAPNVDPYRRPLRRP
jgi:hypothetical protein